MPLPRLIFANKQLAPLIPLLKNRYDIKTMWENRPDLDDLDNVRVLIVAGDSSLDTDLVRRLPYLGLIACASAGYDGIDVDWVYEQGLKLSHAQGVNDEDVADHALGCLILWRRSLLAGDRLIRSDQWRGAPSLTNRSVRGLRLGIVGLGRIGRQLAGRAGALGMQVEWWAPEDKAAEWPRAINLNKLATDSDALVVTARADQQNRGLVSGDVIDALGPNGYFVNVARGSLVDEAALVSALHDGRLGGAALDVFQEEPVNPEFWKPVPNLLMTPHIAGKTWDSFGRIAQQLAKNIDAFLADRPLLTPVRIR